MSRVERDRSLSSANAWVAALFGSAAHWLILAVAQVENTATVVASGSLDSPVLLPLALPLLQFENLMFCAVLLLFLRLLAAVPGGQLTGWCLVTLCNLFVVINQLGYELLFDYLRWSSLEVSLADVAWLQDSVVHSLDAAFVVNIALLVSLGISHALLLSGRINAVLPHSLRRARSVRGFICASLYLFACFVASVSVDHLHIAQHPGSAFVADALGTQYRPASVSVLAGYDMPSGPVTAPVPAPVKATPQTRGDPRGEKRNVVLIVLESIGAKQLLRGRWPDPSVAPFLHRLAVAGQVFEAMYAAYPATIVSNIAITTGGPSLTWEKVTSLDYPYTGPSIVEEFKAQDYATALFSSADLSFGRLDRFLGGLGYDVLHDFGAKGVGFRHVNEANSWGASDAGTLGLAAQWAEQRHREGRPFYLRVQTNLAHHPYNIPQSTAVPVAHANTEKSRYLTAVRYLDSLLEEFHGTLSKAGMARNTVFAVTGDHGEAFGEWHPKNHLHRNFLYEENVRSFLVLNRDGHAFRNTRRRSAPVSHGDILSTLLAAAGLDVPTQFSDRNLLSTDYRHRVQFFHKNGHPEQWGLRDGRWKFIANFSGDHAELFDLEVDPHEQNNVAKLFPARVRDYMRRSASWYGTQNRSFARHLTGRPSVGDEIYALADFVKQGPQDLLVGYLAEVAGAEVGGAEHFTAASRLHPKEALFAWVRWVSYREPHALEFWLIAPDGGIEVVNVRATPDDVVSQVALPLSTARIPGRWRLEIHERGTSTAPLAQIEFDISRHVALQNPARVPLGPDAVKIVRHSLSQGNGKPPSGQAIPSEDTLSITVDWPAPAHYDRVVTVRWRGPTGRRLEYPAVVRAGSQRSTIVHNGPYPMTPGAWWLTLWHGQRLAAHQVVTIAQTDNRLAMGKRAAPNLIR
ncbi:MAG: arylsulfatase A-like enzyme [Gammaproteobacteria bacterium]|jgi:arylsulfatase A-like enzyme